jgi:hypothetical protein
MTIQHCMMCETDSSSMHKHGACSECHNHQVKSVHLQAGTAASQGGLIAGMSSKTAFKQKLYESPTHQTKHSTPTRWHCCLSGRVDAPEGEVASNTAWKYSNKHVTFQNTFENT